MQSPSDPVHFSNLKEFSLSPAHYLASIGNEDDKLAFRIGRLSHLHMLGMQPGARWDVYDGRRAGKEWEAFKAARDGVDIFTKKENELALAMAAAIKKEPLAEVLLRGEFEVPVEWTHAMGRRCATRGIDVLNRVERYTVELKTAVSSHPVRFARDAIRYGYHAQGSWFRDAARSLGVEIDRHFIVACEKKFPHVVTVFVVTPRAMVEGDKVVRSWMEQLQGCEESGQFPGYAQYIVDLDTAPEEDELVFDEDEDEEAPTGEEAA